MSVSGPVNPNAAERAAAVLQQALPPYEFESWVQQVEHDTARSRWYLRFTCDGRDGSTIVFDLHERTLRYELYFLPAPEGDVAGLHQWLLRKNDSLTLVHFSVGEHGDVYLRGRMDLDQVDSTAIERVVAAMYLTTEQLFPLAIRMLRTRKRTVR